MSYQEILRRLKISYDRKVDERNRKAVAAWKADERARFLAYLRTENKADLLEIGAGTGIHGKFFSENGLDVICTDLSSENVKLCHQKGLKASEMDFRQLGFPKNSFGSIYAMNCLLHVPRDFLPDVLGEVKRTLALEGIFYWGQYGGSQHQGIYPQDHYQPKRFFSFLTDEFLQELAANYFELISFKSIPLEGEKESHFQSVLLRKNHA